MYGAVFKLFVEEKKRIHIPIFFFPSPVRNNVFFSFQVKAYILGYGLLAFAQWPNFFDFRRPHKPLYYELREFFGLGDPPVAYFV